MCRFFGWAFEDVMQMDLYEYMLSFDAATEIMRMESPDTSEPSATGHQAAMAMSTMLPHRKPLWRH